MQQAQNATSKEFKALAALIVEAAEDTHKDNFKLNLFPERAAQKSGGTQKAENDDDDQIIIDIDFSGNAAKEKEKVSHVAKDFGDINLDQANEALIKAKDDL